MVMQLSTMQPVVVTAETLQILAKQEKYPELLALYMAYVEITTWQHDNSVKAATRFMATRLRWNKDKVTRTKKVLVGLGLVEDAVRKDESGKITAHYILVKHVTNPGGGIERGVDFEAQSANDSKLSANDYSSEMLEAIEKVYTLWLVYMVVDPEIRLHGTTDERQQALEAAKKNTKLTDKRKLKVKARLADAGSARIHRAIVAISNSPFHRDGIGDNGGQGTWTAKLEWLCHSYEKVEEWSNKYKKEN